MVLNFKGQILIRYFWALVYKLAANMFAKLLEIFRHLLNNIGL